MPRPTSKAELLHALDTERTQLEALLAPLNVALQTEPHMVGPWSVKDVLAHLAEWSLMVLRWYEAGRRGERPPTPAPDLTWKQIPELNQRIWRQWRDTPLEEVWEAFRSSSEALRAAVESCSDEQLFGARVYAWTNTTTLGAYFVSVGPSHYQWARTEVRKGLKARTR